MKRDRVIRFAHSMLILNNYKPWKKTIRENNIQKIKAKLETATTVLCGREKKGSRLLLCCAVCAFLPVENKSLLPTFRNFDLTYKKNVFIPYLNFIFNAVNGTMKEWGSDSGVRDRARMAILQYWQNSIKWSEMEV